MSANRQFRPSLRRYPPDRGRDASGGSAGGRGRAGAATASSPSPAGSLGRLEWLVEWLAAWRRRRSPSSPRPPRRRLCREPRRHRAGRSRPFPMRWNQQMLGNFANGGAAINQICAAYGLGFKVFDLAVDMPTRDITREPAMGDNDAVATMAFAWRRFAGGHRIFWVSAKMGRLATPPSRRRSSNRALMAARQRIVGWGAAPASMMPG